VERHETPDPVRPDAMDPGFHCVRGPLRATHPAPRGRILWNAVKPGIQCVLTPWIPGFTTSGAQLLRPRTASGSRPPRHPLRAIHPREPECQPNERRTRTQTERNP